MLGLILEILQVYKHSEKDTQGVSPLKTRNGNGKSEFEEAEEFNGQFSDVFTKSEYKQVPFWIDLPHLCMILWSQRKG